MMFKHFFSVILLFSLAFFQPSTTNAQVSCPPVSSSGGGGLDISKDKWTYVERGIHSFKIEIEHSAFQPLITAFDAIYPPGSNKRKAGFCFIPIICSDLTSPNQVNYQTLGVRVVLAYWIGDGDNVTPDELGFFGFDNMCEAFTITENYQGDVYSSLVNTATLQTLPIGPLRTIDVIDGNNYTNATATFTAITSTHNFFNDYIESREFDLTFLDYYTYEYFRTNQDFYSNGNPSQGIVMERTVIDMDVPATTKAPSIDGLTYRGMIFRPAPVPNILATPSETSLAYDYGGNCPPYWVRDTTPNICSVIKSSLAQQMNENFSRFAVFKEELKNDELINIKNQTNSLQITQFVIGFLLILILILIILVYRIVGKSSPDNDEFSSQIKSEK